MAQRSRSLADRWEAVEAFFLPASAWQHGLLHFWRERILLVLILLSGVIGFVALIPSVGLAIKEGLWSVAVLDTAAYLIIIFLALAKRTAYRVRAWTACVVLYLLGLGLSLFLGLLGAAYIWLFAFAVVAGLLIGLRAGLLALGINAATFLLVGVLIHLGRLPWARLLENPLEKWSVLGVSFLLINSVITISTAFILRGMEQALEREHLAGRDLERERGRLEKANRRLQGEMNERAEAEQALRQSEKRFRDLFNSISDLIYTQDMEGRFLTVNQALCHTFGYRAEELVGTPASDYMNPDFRRAYRSEYLERLKREGRHQGTTVYYAKSGEPRYIEYISRLVTPEHGESYISGSGRDVTQRILAQREMDALQAQLQQAKKMEALGTLAGGIAHDFNNILATIMGYAELAQEAAELDRPAPAAIQQIVKSADRARELVNQILAFSRRASSRLKPLDLNQVIRETAPILKRTIPKMIEVRLDLDPDLCPVNGDHTQIEQVLLNLAGNAKDAMPDGGRLGISTGNLTIDQAEGGGRLGLDPGPYVLLTVSDTGLGLDQQTMEHIFEPFYTTKEVGKGTGLGLASVYGIVKSHQGQIDCASRPGQGAVFRIYLPALPADAASPSAEIPRDEAIPGGAEAVLLVDDEEALRQVSAEFLESMGYRVTVAGSGEEALDIYRSRDGGLDLVIMDLSMPGMGGHQALKELLSINPALKVIIASGYTAGGRVRDTLEQGAAGYITKPYRRAELLQTVRSVLDA